MKRWHLTLGLAGVALAAAALAPRLQAMLTPLPPVPPPIDPIDVVPVEIVEAPASQEQGRLVVTAELDHAASMQGVSTERFLTVTVTAPAAGGLEERGPLNVAVVMDASGSMGASKKIDKARDAAAAVSSHMKPGDTFSLVTFSDTSRVVVPATDVAQRGRIQNQIARVLEGGGTNLYAGLEDGQDQLLRTLDDGEIGRIIVLSDGNANVGVTDPGSLAALAQRASDKGIAVSTMGLGVDYNEDLLAQLADVGGGTYDYIDDPAQLQRVFVDELERTSMVVTRDTRVRLTFPDNVQPRELIGWTGERIHGGWDVFLGDMPAGSTRKIVVRVDLTAGPETFVAGTARATYVDLMDGTRGVSSDTAEATGTTDAARVTASSNPAARVHATKALGGHYLERSTRAYSTGDRREADRLLETGARRLRHAADELGDASLLEEAKTLEAQRSVYQRYAPTSSNGRRAIKMNKEIVRGAAR